VPQPLGQEVDCESMKLKAGEPSNLRPAFFLQKVHHYARLQVLAVSLCFLCAGLLFGLVLSAEIIRSNFELFFYDAMGGVMVFFALILAVVGVVLAFRNSYLLRSLLAPCCFLFCGLLLGLAASALQDVEGASDMPCCDFVDWTSYCLVGASVCVAAGLFFLSHGVDVMARRDFREQQLLYNFDRTNYEAAWPHVHVQMAPGPSAEPVEGSDVGGFCVLVARMILHGFLFFYAWDQLPEPSRPGTFYEHCRRIIVYAEALGYLGSWFAVLVGVGVYFGAAHMPTTAKASTAYATAAAMKSAASLSAFRLLAYIDPVKVWAEGDLARHSNYRLGALRCTLGFQIVPPGAQNQRQGHIYSVVFTGLLVISYGLVAAVGVLAVVVKLGHLDFLRQDEFDLWSLVLLASLASHVAAAQDPEARAHRCLAEALQDAADCEVASWWGPGAHGSRVVTWKKGFCKKAIEENGAVHGLIRMCTLDTGRVAKRLLGVRSIQVEDRVISNGFGAVPWGTQGQVVQLDPIPTVRWDGLYIPKEVQVEHKNEILGVNGYYRLASLARPSKDFDLGMPIYKRDGGDEILAPLLRSSMGNQLLPIAEGWAIYDKEGGRQVCVWKVPVEHSPEALKFNVACTPIFEQGEEPLVWCTQLTHMNLLWGSSCGSFVVW